jgi:hypothetical protein
VTGTPANLGLVQPFPAPGQLLALAYRELDRAATGSPEQIRALGDARLLPRPWEPASCRTPQLWLWLDAVVDWLVTEYVWEVPDTIPACWPQHPTWCMRSPCWPINAAAPITPSPVTPWRNGTATACPPSPNARSHGCETLRGRPPRLACQRPPHPKHGRDQPTHPGEPLCEGHRFYETYRGEGPPASTAGAR